MFPHAAYRPVLTRSCHQHGSYNTPARDYRPIGDAREIEMVDRNPYKYKYQGQERQDELGLNWDSFKWRNYDYAIGRFMSVDPLAEGASVAEAGIYALWRSKISSSGDIGGSSPGGGGKSGPGLKSAFFARNKNKLSAKSKSKVKTVTVSGVQRAVQTGSRGGKYYINKNGKRTYLNREGTKRKR